MTTEATMARYLKYRKSAQFIVDQAAGEAAGAPIDDAHAIDLQLALTALAKEKLEADDPDAEAILADKTLVGAKASLGRDIHGPFADVDVFMHGPDESLFWVLNAAVDLSDADTSRLDLPFALRPPTTVTSETIQADET